MTIRNTAILCVVVAVLSAGLTRYYFPQVQTQTKTVEVQHDVVHNNIQMVTRTVKKPDGETDITTTTIDNTVRTDTNTETQQTVQLAVKKDWLVSATASMTGINFANPTYGVQVNRRILGPIYVGGTVNTKGEFGVSLGMEF